MGLYWRILNNDKPIGIYTISFDGQEMPNIEFSRIFYGELSFYKNPHSVTGKICLVYSGVSIQSVKNSILGKIFPDIKLVKTGFKRQDNFLDIPFP